jgi:hypothetical protein
MGGVSVPQADLRRAVGTIRDLAGRFPGRLSGTPAQRDAAAWFLDAFRAAGLDAHLEAFRSLNSTVVPGRLEVVGGAGEGMLAQTLGFARATPPGGLVLELVDAAGGGADDYPPGAAGRATLVSGYEGPATPEKARAAVRRGAAALVYISPRARSEELAYRAVKSVWGVPAPAELAEMPRIPALAVSYEQGQRLRRLLGEGRPVTVRLAAEQPEPTWDDMANVVATLEPAGGGPAEEYVLVHAHLDSWDPGLTDNLTGNVLALELARAFRPALTPGRRGLIFCLWDGHEIAEAAGSASYVERHWDFLRDRVVCQVNIDSPGLADARRVLARQTPEMLRFQQEIHAALGVDDAVYESLDRSADQSFFGAGLPGCYVFGTGPAAPAPDELPVLWYTHTRADNMERFGEAHLAQFAAIYAAYLDRLTATARLPFDFAPYVERIEAALGRWGGADLDLEPLRVDLGAIRRGIGLLEGTADTTFNARGRALARLLVASLLTTVSPYRQDRYGATEFTAASFPATAGIDAFARGDGADPREAQLAAALRERNRLADTLRRARALLTDATI